jgi:hypothetical protein
MKRRARRLLIVLFEHDLFELNVACMIWKWDVARLDFWRAATLLETEKRDNFLHSLRRASLCRQPLCVQDCGGYGVMMSCGCVSKNQQEMGASWWPFTFGAPEKSPKNQDQVEKSRDILQRVVEVPHLVI